MSSVRRNLKCAGLLLCAVSFADASSARSVYQSAELALTQHPEVARQQAQQKLVDAREDSAQADYLPKVRLTMGVGREDSNTLSTRSRPGGSSIELERREAGVRVEQMLFDGWRTHWQSESAGEQVNLTSWQRKHILSDLSLRAIEAHLAVLEARRIQDLQQQYVSALSGILNDIEARIQRGKDQPARRSQAMARLARGMAALNQAQTRLSNAEADYLLWVGASAPDTLASTQLVPLPLPEDLDRFKQQVLKHNPRLQGQSAAVRASQAQSKAHGFAVYPYVFVESGANWDANLDGTPGRNSDAYVMLRLNYELYSGGRYSAQQRAARYEAESVRLERDVLRRELERDAEQAWQDWLGLSAQLEALNDAARFTEDTRQNYYKLFAIGQQRLLDLLDIEQEWLDAQIQSQRVLTQSELARFKLLWLSGGMLRHLREQGVHIP